MQFGIALPHFSRLATREAVLTLGREAEALGYESLWTTDHVLMAADQPEPYGTILEAAMTLGYVAAITERIRLGTSVIVLPQREPVLLAKQAATLDVLSNGRLILGVGAGWNEREFGFLGANFHNRGRRLDEYIQALRTLWSEPDPRIEGQYVHVADVSFRPRPVQPGGPPIWLGGGSRAALRRAATLCDGWHATGTTVEEFAAGMQTIRALANERQVVGSVRLPTAVGRKLPEQRTARGLTQAQLSGSREEIVDRIQAYAAAGASEMVLYFGAHDLETNLAEMRRFAEEVSARV
ncbi:MAG: LLM class F420-dependent oxidoreductase [Chloroflexi bacterium]|nr:LLM class F420-dependent oxidoreductase [Chloroflexota bacterium]